MMEKDEANQERVVFTMHRWSELRHGPEGGRITIRFRGVGVFEHFHICKKCWVRGLKRTKRENALSLLGAVCIVSPFLSHLNIQNVISTTRDLYQNNWNKRCSLVTRFLRLTSKNTINNAKFCLTGEVLYWIVRGFDCVIKILYILSKRIVMFVAASVLPAVLPLALSVKPLGQLVLF